MGEVVKGIVGENAGDKWTGERNPENPKQPRQQRHACRSASARSHDCAP